MLVVNRFRLRPSILFCFRCLSRTIPHVADSRLPGTICAAIETVSCFYAVTDNFANRNGHSSERARESHIQNCRTHACGRSSAPRSPCRIRFHILHTFPSRFSSSNRTRKPRRETARDVFSEGGTDNCRRARRYDRNSDANETTAGKRPASKTASRKRAAPKRTAEPGTARRRASSTAASRTAPARRTPIQEPVDLVNSRWRRWLRRNPIYSEIRLRRGASTRGPRTWIASRSIRFTTEQRL